MASGAGTRVPLKPASVGRVPTFHGPPDHTLPVGLRNPQDQGLLGPAEAWAVHPGTGDGGGEGAATQARKQERIVLTM